MRIEIRNDQAVIEGYVNVAERMSKPIRDIRGTFREQVAQGTFTKALQENKNVELRFNHGRILGDQQSGVLELREDNIGLYARAYISDEEIIQKARNNELLGWSFGFRNPKDKWVKAEGQPEVRQLESIELVEVSILDKQPAYIATSISMRSDNEEELLEHRANDDNIEFIEEREEKPLNEEFKNIIKELDK